MKILWRLAKEAVRYRWWLLLSIFGTLSLTAVNLIAPRIMASMTGVVAQGMTQERFKSVLWMAATLLGLFLVRILRIRNEGKEFPLVMLEQYRDRFEEAEYLICRYKLYYQLIGCLQVFFDWFMNDMPMPVEKVVSMLNEMNIPRTIHYRNFPNITVRIE